MKCLTLCWILASSAWAIQPTQLAVGVPLTQVGQPVDLVAALYPPTVMEGTIAFTSDTVPIAGCEALPVDTGRAVCRTSFSKPGSYAIAASYGGTTSWGKSSGSATLTVGKLEPWAYIAMDPKDPIYGNNLIVNALVLGANGIAPTGSFTFYDNGKQLVVRPLKTDARASLDMTLPVGDHRVQAVYGGDANYIVSRPAEITFHVSQGTPVVAVSATPAQLGQQVTITASVTALSPTGSVTFQGVPGCESVPLAGGSAQCSATFKELGEVVVTAVYSGDGNLQQGSAAVRIQVYKAVPTLVVSAAPEESVYGQSGQAGALALGAPGLSPPSGPVVFTVDNTPPVIASLDQKGHASLDLQLGAGRHTIQALYGGDANYASVPPKTASVTVARGTPVVAISSTPAQLGQIVTLTASVTALNPGGAVAFDGVPGCAAVPLDQGQARCQAVFPQLGELQVTANYSGDANLLPAKATMKLAVAKAVSSLYLAATEQPVYGKTIRVSALASPAPGLPPPTGMVSFSDGAAFLGSALLDAEGRASLEPPLTAGTHTIQAVYNGDSNYLPPGAKSITVVVAKATPAVVVSSTPAQVGQTVVVSVTVSGPSPTGSVTFGGAPNCGTVLLEAGRARCQTVYRQLGDAPVTAIYSGDANHNGASASSTVAVRKAVPGLYLAVAPQSPVFGQTAKVSALLMGAAGLPAPAGSVLFSDGAQSSAAPPDTEGRASWSAAFPAGSRRVTATFAGDANYAEASAAVTFVVARAETTTALAAPAGGPFTATVAAVAPGSGTPTGSVRFLRDGVAIGTAVLGRGVATLVSSVSGAITAEYSGDANFLASASTATAPPPKAIVMLSSDRNPAAAGAPVTFTAVVTPNPGTVIPTGTIRFTADGTLLGSMILSAGRGTVTSALASGSHAVEAAYAGDSVYPAASGTLTQIVTGAPSGLGLSASVPSAVYGQPVTFTAQLPAGGSGTVKFWDSAAVLGTAAALNDGAAVLTVPSFTPGSHTITASWNGDATFAGASAELSLTVGRAATETLLTFGTGAVSVRVTAVAPGAGIPSGVVRFVNPRTDALLASATLANGSAAVVLGHDAALVAAVYDGDVNFTGSVSEASSTLTVANAASYGSGTVAPDEIVSLFGPIPAGLASVQVTDRESVTRDARVLHSVAGQAAVVLPSGMAAGPATVIAGEWQALVTVAPVAPGLFTADASGKGPAAGFTEPIEIGAEGAAIVLYGTGFRHATAMPVCLVAGRPVEVVYAGRQGEFPGLDQLNIVLPPSLRGAGTVPLEWKVDGVAANGVMLAVQ